MYIEPPLKDLFIYENFYRIFTYWPRKIQIGWNTIAGVIDIDMAVKVQFEIGHTSKVRSKKKQAFTHDWEIYVQGVNKADISAFVDKVVFILHESFHKPKRGKATWSHISFFAPKQKIVFPLLCSYQRASVYYTGVGVCWLHNAYRDILSKSRWAQAYHISIWFGSSANRTTTSSSRSQDLGFWCAIRRVSS